MTRKNPFVRMSWIESYPHLTQDDVAILQAELKHLYPTLVMFPRSYHFHKLGDEPRRPEFIDDMVKHFLPTIDLKWGYRWGEAIAVRVPWPEDITTGNPQRLIGRPHRQPFDDSKEAFRRFGRTVYFKPDIGISRMMLCGITVQPPVELFLAHCSIAAKDMPSFQFLGSLGGFHIEMPHDTEDPEVVAFVKSVSSIVNKLTTRTACLYDGITGNALVSWSGQPVSRSYMRRCALEPHLYLYCNYSTYDGHPLFTGPTPAQRRKWRREAGLSDDVARPPISVPKFLPHQYLAWSRANTREFPFEAQIEVNRLANRALYEYAAARTPGYEMLPLGAEIPRVLPEQVPDTWRKCSN